MSDLIAKLDAVKDEQSFVAFLDSLAQDRRNDPEAWQWDKIEDFLEAAASWSEASRSGLKYYQVPDNAWKRFADIIYSGKIYE
jgi:hypothetical protein